LKKEASKIEASFKTLSSIFSVFLEGVSETREYDAQEDINGQAISAHHKVTVTQTTFGVETMRNLVSTGGFRFGVGLGIGLGLGIPSRELTILTTQEKRDQESESLWLSLLLTATARGRYTVYRQDNIDVGIALALRYWGFPAIGPSSDDVTGYNGPDFRTLHQVGYLAGVSVGF
jgi:hypothetical protein